MLLASVVLAIFTLALAWPVPILLARSRWPLGAPGTALVLWQSIALSGGLSMIGALLCYGLIPFGGNLWRGPEGLVHALLIARLPARAGLHHVFALCSAFLLGVHLLLNLIATVVRSERQRRRHLTLVMLLGQPFPDRPRTRVIDHAAPVAYCLPGATRSVTVLSAGMLALLTADELRAVIAHEGAHLRQQHHTVLLAFKSWRSALPWFPIANRAENAVALLVEMLADDQARRVVDDPTLARAIVLAGTAGAGPVDAPAGFTDPAPPPDMVTQRVQRLLAGPRAVPLPARAAVLIAAAALLAAPTLLLLALA